MQEAKLMQSLSPELHKQSGQNVRDFEDVDLPKLQQEIRDAEAIADGLQNIYERATGRRYKYLK